MLDASDAERHFLEVSTFQDLISSSYHGKMNAICWTRQLVGNFEEIVEKVALEENIATLDPRQLLDLELSEQGQQARDILINDWQLLKAQGASPTLNLIREYERDDSVSFFPTDVYSFHVDRSPIPIDTFLCTYHGDASEILPNAQAEQKVLIPEIRTKLQKLYDRTDDGFESFLSEYFFDLHYAAKPEASPINLGLGNLWKLAVDHPESEVLHCIHRAPEEKTGKTRLLMIC